MFKAFRLNSTLSTLVLAVLIAGGVASGVHYFQRLDGKVDAENIGKLLTNFSNETATQVASNESAGNKAETWAASAPGRVGPKGGNVKVRAEASGVVVRVLAASSDKVMKGDVLALLKDDDIQAKLAAARAEVAVRLGERDEEPEKNTLMVERRKADDDVAKAERALHLAQLNFDRRYMVESADVQDGGSVTTDLSRERKQIEDARMRVDQAIAKREEVLKKAGMPMPTRLDSGLALARSDLRLAELALERTRVRATASGTVMRLNIVAGEATSPTSPQAVAVIGNMAALEVVAEVDERDVTKVVKGQSVIVRSNAFPGQDFVGTVASVDPALGPPVIKAQGAHNPADVDVLKVKIALEGKSNLMPGMRVDVFFQKKGPVKAALRQ